MKKLFIFISLLLPFCLSCASFWPWMYSKKVAEEGKAQDEVVKENYKSFSKSQEPPKDNVITRVIGRREKGFDYNQDGRISREERKFFLKMRKTREQEKMLKGEK